MGSCLGCNMDYEIENSYKKYIENILDNTNIAISNIEKKIEENDKNLKKILLKLDTKSNYKISNVVLFRNSIEIEISCDNVFGKNYAFSYQFSLHDIAYMQKIRSDLINKKIYFEDTENQNLSLLNKIYFAENNLNLFIYLKNKEYEYQNFAIRDSPLLAGDDNKMSSTYYSPHNILLIDRNDLSSMVYKKVSI